MPQQTKSILITARIIFVQPSARIRTAIASPSRSLPARPAETNKKGKSHEERIRFM